MRIRSNLTDDSLYEPPHKGRGGGGLPAGATGVQTRGVQTRGVQTRGVQTRRRLFRLGLLLVLVLFLMREAANPDVYRNFFGALGAPLADEPLPQDLLEEEEIGSVLGGDVAESPAERVPSMDPTTISQVSDATIWQPGDAPVFYQLLNAGRQGGTLRNWGEPVFVGFVSLLDQPAVYRGQRVGVVGTAVRAEKIKAAGNQFGIADYWLVWVRPEDGSQRPVMGYCVELPETLTGLPQSGVAVDGRRVLIDGIFLRRHLYQSAKGSELAPVIVGRVRSLDSPKGSTNEPPVNAAQPAVAGNNPSGTLIWIVLACGLVGVGFTIVVAWSTARNSRRRREVRRRGTENVDLSSFSSRGLF